MSSNDAPPDDERLYALLREEAWLEALGWLHAAWRRLDGDARARRAAEVFDEAFFENLGARPSEAMERRLMLHHGRMRALPDAQLTRLTDALAGRERALPGGARSWRHLTSQEGATRPEGEAESIVRRDAFDVDGVRITCVQPSRTQPDARRSLFKSPPEHTLFAALRAVFPTYLVQPNVALNAALDFERIGHRLTQAERRYFFRALVDAVVVDPMDALRPVYFFELDSAHHDTAGAKEKDALKDAILVKAGQVLFRLRQKRSSATVEALEAAIRRAIRREA